MFAVKVFYFIHCGFAEVKLKSVSFTLYSLSPSCISLLSRTIKMSGLEVAMAHVAGPTHTNKIKQSKKSINCILAPIQRGTTRAATDLF